MVQDVEKLESCALLVVQALEHGLEVPQKIKYRITTGLQFHFWVYE